MSTGQFYTVLTSVCIALRINGYWKQLFLRPNSECVSIQLYLRIEADSIAVTFYVVFGVLEDGECLETEYTWTELWSVGKDIGKKWRWKRQ